MRSEDRLLDREAGFFVAKQLRDEREIEPLARFDAAVEESRDQPPPERAKVVPCLGRPRQSGQPNAFSPTRPGNAGSV